MRRVPRRGKGEAGRRRWHPPSPQRDVRRERCWRVGLQPGRWPAARSRECRPLHSLGGQTDRDMQLRGSRLLSASGKKWHHVKSHFIQLWLRTEGWKNGAMRWGYMYIHRRERGVCVMAMKKALKSTPGTQNQHLVRSHYPTRNFSWTLCSKVKMQLLVCCMSCNVVRSLC